MQSMSLISFLFAFGLIAPNAVYALPISEIIENAKSGNGVYVESHSSASTGGQTAASGQSVTTGDSSASSRIETKINADGSGGTVNVKVETSKNGETTNKEYSEIIEAGEGAKVEVHASSDTDSQSTILINNEEVGADKVEVSANGDANSAPTIAIESKISTFFTVQIPYVFKKVFSFLWIF